MEEKGLLVQILQQDFHAFVVADAAELRPDGLQCRLHLRSHRLVTAVQQTAKRKKTQNFNLQKKRANGFFVIRVAPCWSVEQMHGYLQFKTSWKCHVSLVL